MCAYNDAESHYQLHSKLARLRERNTFFRKAVLSKQKHWFSEAILAAWSGVVCQEQPLARFALLLRLYKRPNIVVWTRCWTSRYIWSWSGPPTKLSFGPDTDQIYLVYWTRWNFFGPDLVQTQMIWSNGLYFILNNISPKPYVIKNLHLVQP